jgi:hypothetical protein
MLLRLWGMSAYPQQPGSHDRMCTCSILSELALLMTDRARSGMFGSP